MHKSGHSRTDNQRRGFTLTEVLVASSLALVVFAVAFTAMIRFGRVHYSLVTQADLDREFRYAINVITDDIRGLQSIDIERPTDEDAEQGALPEAMITLPSIQLEDGVLPDKTEVLYQVSDSGELRRVYAEYSNQGTVLNNQTTRLLRGVSAFDLVRVNGSSSFDLTLTSVRHASGKEYEKTLTTRVASRN